MSSIALEPKKTPALDLREQAGSAVLLEVKQQDITLSMWNRSIPEPVAVRMQSWLEEDDCEILEDIHVDQLDVRGLIAARLAENDWDTYSKDGNWLIDDLTDLVYRFSEAANTSSVRFRLETLRHAGCCKFHTDFLEVRMLCTYFGPGTEWVPGHAVCREEIGCSAGSLDEANRRIVPDFNKIQQAPTGTVLIFKGDLYPGEEGGGLVHRSAPVTASNHTRLLLRMDPTPEDWPL